MWISLAMAFARGGYKPEDTKMHAIQRNYEGKGERGGKPGERRRSFLSSGRSSPLVAIGDKWKERSQTGDP